MAFGEKISTWFDGQWRDGNTPILGAADHATWLGTLVFDGARTFEGVTPDLDLHCARIINSARAMGMEPPVDAAQIEALIRERLAHYDPQTALYLRPMMWSLEGAPGMIAPERADTGFAICIEDLPMPAFGQSALGVSSYRRPHQDTALTEAKAACLYPNNGRIMCEARAAGFDNALSLDLEGHVAETASSNVFLVRDGEIFTPTPNGTFLAGITRLRCINLMRAEGLQVHEASLTLDDFDDAQEIFLTGNAAKVTRVSRYQDRTFDDATIATRVRDMYWDYSKSGA